MDRASFLSAVVSAIKETQPGLSIDKAETGKGVGDSQRIKREQLQVSAEDTARELEFDQPRVHEGGAAKLLQVLLREIEFLSSESSSYDSLISMQTAHGPPGKRKGRGPRAKVRRRRRKPGSISLSGAAPRGGLYLPRKSIMGIMEVIIRQTEGKERKEGTGPSAELGDAEGARQLLARPADASPATASHLGVAALLLLPCGRISRGDDLSSSILVPSGAPSPPSAPARLQDALGAMDGRLVRAAEESFLLRHEVAGAAATLAIAAAGMEGAGTEAIRGGKGGGDGGEAAPAASGESAVAEKGEHDDDKEEDIFAEGEGEWGESAEGAGGTLLGGLTEGAAGPSAGTASAFEGGTRASKGVRPAWAGPVAVLEALAGRRSREVRTAAARALVEVALFAAGGLRGGAGALNFAGELSRLSARALQGVELAEQSGGLAAGSRPSVLSGLIAVVEALEGAVDEEGQTRDGCEGGPPRVSAPLDGCEGGPPRVSAPLGAALEAASGVCEGIMGALAAEGAVASLQVEGSLKSPEGGSVPSGVLLLASLLVRVRAAGGGSGAAVGGSGLQAARRVAMRCSTVLRCAATLDTEVCVALARIDGFREAAIGGGGGGAPVHGREEAEGCCWGLLLAQSDGCSGGADRGTGPADADAKSESEDSGAGDTQERRGATARAAADRCGSLLLQLQMECEDLGARARGELEGARRGTAPEEASFGAGESKCGEPGAGGAESEGTHSADAGGEGAGGAESEGTHSADAGGEGEDGAAGQGAGGGAGALQADLGSLQQVLAEAPARVLAGTGPGRAIAAARESRARAKLVQESFRAVEQQLAATAPSGGSCADGGWAASWKVATRAAAECATVAAAAAAGATLASEELLARAAAGEGRAGAGGPAASEEAVALTAGALLADESLDASGVKRRGWGKGGDGTGAAGGGGAAGAASGHRTAGSVEAGPGGARDEESADHRVGRDLGEVARSLRSVQIGARGLRGLLEDLEKGGSKGVSSAPTAAASRTGLSSRAQKLD